MRIQLSFVSNFQRTAVFISGQGSCLQAFLESAEFQNIKLVITNKKNTYGELKAKRFGIKVLWMDKATSFADVDQVLKNLKIQKIFLAGFMKIIPADFINSWTNHIFNIHPSLLPDFKGLQAFERAFEQKAKLGASIHHVVSEMDAGKIVLQQQICVNTSDINEAHFFLRLSEQHLIREFVYKGAELCTRF